MHGLVNACLKKRQYGETEARWLVGLAHRQRGQEGTQHAYRCPACGFWHVGHKNRRARRR